jgi:uncharacterized protein YecA (UPF0149 family)
MRPTDRDYCVSTIAVLQDQLRMIQDVASDMTMRLDELDETLLYLYGQKEDEELDELMVDSWESGYEYRRHLVEKDAESEPPSPKLCMCDDCWSDDEPEDRGESKKEYFDWIDDVLRRTRRAPQDYRMD